MSGSENTKEALRSESLRLCKRDKGGKAAMQADCERAWLQNE